MQEWPSEAAMSASLHPAPEGVRAVGVGYGSVTPTRGGRTGGSGWKVRRSRDGPGGGGKGQRGRRIPTTREGNRKGRIHRGVYHQHRDVVCFQMDVFI